MNSIILGIAALALAGAISGTAYASVPFEYSSTGVEIVDYRLDSNDIEIILDVKVTEPIGSLQIELDRAFFDSRYKNQDDSFTIIADGDLVYYNEVIKTRDSRTIKLSLTEGTEQVEIFGSHLNGNTAVSQSESIVEPQIIIQEDTTKIEQLKSQIKNLEKENARLVEENKELDARIFELENLVDALELQVNNLNALVSEQVKVIYNWVLGTSFS